LEYNVHAAGFVRPKNRKTMLFQAAMPNAA